MQGTHGAAAAASVPSMDERKMIYHLMTLDWRSLAKHSGPYLPPRMWSDHIYDSQIGLHKKPSQEEMKSAREALDQRVRNQWCNQILEELTLDCMQQAGTASSQPPSHAEPPHRIFLQKKGDAVRTATAIVHGNRWHGSRNCINDP